MDRPAPGPMLPYGHAYVRTPIMVSMDDDDFLRLLDSYLEPRFEPVAVNSRMPRAVNIVAPRHEAG